MTKIYLYVCIFIFYKFNYTFFILVTYHAYLRLLVSNSPAYITTFVLLVDFSGLRLVIVVLCAEQVKAYVAAKKKATE